MDGTSLVEGRTYAFREKRVPGSELHKVKLIEKVGRGGKLKVRFHTGPHPGLEEYVSTRQLVVSWPEAQSFLQDEKRQAQVAEECRRTSERVLSQAASEVLGRRAKEPQPSAITATCSCPRMHCGSRGRFRPRRRGSFGA
jgi:hypothetical protein